MAIFNKKIWYNVGEDEANNTNSVANKENMNDLENRIENIISNIYKVGDLFMTTNDENPSSRFGGTWRKLTDDAYLKIVSSNAGKSAGTSKEHKIPINSIPSHNHELVTDKKTSIVKWIGSGGNIDITEYGERMKGFNDLISGNTGGGQAYYPYYLGVYVWIKEA